MEKRLAGWAASSQDPAVISNKIRGAILALSSLIILVASNFFSISLNAGDVTDLATIIGTTAGAIWMVYGGVLQLVSWFARTE